MNTTRIQKTTLKKNLMELFYHSAELALQPHPRRSYYEEDFGDGRLD
jgi:hypothetical protein